MEKNKDEQVRRCQFNFDLPWYTSGNVVRKLGELKKIGWYCLSHSEIRQYKTSENSNQSLYKIKVADFSFNGKAFDCIS